MNSFTTRSFSLSFAALLLAPLAAQSTQTFSDSRTQNYGNWVAGGSTTIRGTAAITPSFGLAGSTNVAVGIRNVASVRLFGQTAEGAAMIGNFSANHQLVSIFPSPTFLNTTTASYVVRLGGNTVASASSFAMNFSDNLVADAFPSNSVSYGVGVSVLGFTVGASLSGNVSARANYDLSPTVSFGGSVNNVSVGLSGPLRSSAVGRVRASTTLLGASASASATLTFANTNADANLQVTATGVTGSISYSVQQIRLFIRALASILGATGGLTVVDISVPATSGTLVLTQD